MGVNGIPLDQEDWQIEELERIRAESEAEIAEVTDERQAELRATFDGIFGESSLSGADAMKKVGALLSRITPSERLVIDKLLLGAC